MEIASVDPIDGVSYFNLVPQLEVLDQREQVIARHVRKTHVLHPKAKPVVCRCKHTIDVEAGP